LNEPVLHIAVEDWKYRIGFVMEDANQQVKIYSNLDEVSIFLNGSLQGNYKTDNCPITLSLQMKEGKNIFKVKGEFKGEQVGETKEIFYKDF
jgi:hypothetical protein